MTRRCAGIGRMAQAISRGSAIGDVYQTLVIERRPGRGCGGKSESELRFVEVTEWLLAQRHGVWSHHG